MVGIALFVPSTRTQRCSIVTCCWQFSLQASFSVVCFYALPEAFPAAAWHFAWIIPESITHCTAQGNHLPHPKTKPVTQHVEQLMETYMSLMIKISWEAPSKNTCERLLCNFSQIQLQCTKSWQQKIHKMYRETDIKRKFSIFLIRIYKGRITIATSSRCSRIETCITLPIMLSSYNQSNSKMLYLIIVFPEFSRLNNNKRRQVYISWWCQEHCWTDAINYYSTYITG